MRIVAGEWRGRKLVAPKGEATRPTADRARETLFNMLNSRLGSFEDLRIADLFAGSGALGLEALSRGAAHVLFVEQDRAALDAIRANIAALDEQVKKKALIPFDVVVDRWQGISANVRAKLLSIPPQMAARCANSSKDEVERAAKDLIYQALNELARDVEY
jgi:tRNA1(Val) A37 N6-methylase TrmN6